MIKEFLVNLPLSDAALAAVEIGIIALMAAILVLRRKRISSRQSVEEVYSERRRDEELLYKLRNTDGEGGGHGYRPYEVSYGKEQGRTGASEGGAGGRSTAGAGGVQAQPSAALQLIVRNGYSTKKYLIRLENSFLIGRRETCDLVLDSEYVSAVHCALLNRGGEVYASDAGSSNGTVLSRRTKKKQLSSEPIRVLDGDVLVIAEQVSVEINRVRA